MSFPQGEPVDFIEAGTRTDPYSQESVQDDWGNPVTVLSAPAAVEPIGSDEPVQDGRQAVIVGYRLYFTEALSVDSSWRASVRGEVFNVDGKPAVWRNPWGGLTGTVVQVGRTSG